MSQRRGAYPPEFRQQMVELVRIGRKPSELAKEFGCHEAATTCRRHRNELTLNEKARPNQRLSRA